MTTDEVPESAPGLYDQDWDAADWEALLRRLVDDGLVTWREITTTILGELNPPQVGTQIASDQKGGWKVNHATLHPGTSFMPYVMSWFYDQSGGCKDCGTYLDLQADHENGRETFANPHQADWLSNMCVRCRRHNVAKRESHRNRAGRTLLPAQQALMWILLEIRPRTLLDFARLCRLYGMTMANIRFQEAWAMAMWLQRIDEYVIADCDDSYSLHIWPNGAVTRGDIGQPTPDGSEYLIEEVPGDAYLCMLYDDDGTPKYLEIPIDHIPFAYFMGDRAITDIFCWPLGSGVADLGPKNKRLLDWSIRTDNDRVFLTSEGMAIGQLKPTGVGRAYWTGRRPPGRLPRTDKLGLAVTEE